jgi:hypothetical protein
MLVPKREKKGEEKKPLHVGYVRREKCISASRRHNDGAEYESFAACVSWTGTFQLELKVWASMSGCRRKNGASRLPTFQLPGAVCPAILAPHSALSAASRVVSGPDWSAPAQTRDTETPTTASAPLIMAASVGHWPAHPCRPNDLWDGS